MVANSNEHLSIVICGLRELHRVLGYQRTIHGGNSVKEHMSIVICGQVSRFDYFVTCLVY